MRLRVIPAVAAMAIFILLAGGLRAQELPRATMQDGAFAFADPSGTRLLSVSGLPESQVFQAALCSGGQRSSVRFERRQAAQEGNNGREWSGNFDKLAGDVFAVSPGRIDTGAVCFLASDALLSGAIVLPADSPAGRSECDAGIRGRLASARNRKVVNCRVIASLPEARSLVLAEFTRQDKDALASVVLIDREQMIFADYHAEYRGEGEDLWRVDDGGALDLNDFGLVFLLQRGNFYALGIAWSGAEGLNLSAFVSSDGSRFIKVIADYWYQAPL
jgi:hypothetical protein